VFHSPQRSIGRDVIACTFADQGNQKGNTSMRLKATRVLLALVAISAIGGTAVSSAWASGPEFKPVPTKRHFKSTNAGTTLTAGGAQANITCAKGVTSGEITSSTTVGNVIETFTGCTAVSNSNIECTAQTVGAKSGEIVTHTLQGVLGAVKSSVAPSEVGLALWRQGDKFNEGPQFTLEATECNGELAVFGSSAMEVAPTKKKQTTIKLVMLPDEVTFTLGSGVKETSWLETGGRVFKERGTYETTFEEALEVT